ncbi:MAG TPA: hypothetical protein VHA56_12825 [Mucilaginibacter sp.]|nr:hypothetical protein [Mucilaginibacter sp.]
MMQYYYTIQLMSHRKPLIRRTFLQERYEILIKKQREGTANFNELTELDEIVNRDPSIREIVLIENHFISDPNDEQLSPGSENAPNKIVPQQNLFDKLRSFLSRLFFAQTYASDPAL